MKRIFTKIIEKYMGQSSFMSKTQRNRYCCLLFRTYNTNQIQEVILL